MGCSRLVLAVLLAISVSLGGHRSAQAFHSGWTGNCDGCHGTTLFVDGTSFGQAVTPSEICLRCHAAARPTSSQVATHPAPPKGTPPAALTPGGDFAYLLKNYDWTELSGERSASPGERHGHNIVAPAYGYIADTTLFTAPGGNYPSDALACISCHDPHGNYRLVDESGTIARSGVPIIGSGSYGTPPTPSEAVGTFRLLAGKGYSTKGAAGHTFNYDPPVVVAPQNYNRSESEGDTRVAYGKGVSEWCANCHPAFLNRASGGSHQHPSGIALGEATAGMYNRYAKTGDFSGSQDWAFTSLVPFQTGEVTNVQQLAALTTSLAGPQPEDKIMCLTCHRAHASAWDSMSRWNTKGSFLTVKGEYPGVDAAGKGSDGKTADGKTRAEYKKAMYDRSATRFATYQRSLCNKCHAKD